MMLLRIGLTDFPIDLLQRFAISSIAIDIPGLARPILIRLNSTDPNFLRKVFVGQEYEHSLPADPKVIIDVGSKIGHATAWFSARFPRATIIAVEPDPDNYRILQRNCSELTRVNLINAALWVDKRSPSDFCDIPHNQRMENCGDTATTGRKEQVTSITIDHLAHRFNFDQIDILRLDIEGDEKAVFEGNDLRFLDRVDCIAIECHDQLKPGCFRATSNALRNEFRHSTKGQTNFFYRRLSAIETSPNQRSVWLVSDGRSGSTWLSSLLNYRQTFAEYFEPLHSMFSPEVFGEPLIRYERPGQLSYKLRDFYARVFSRRWSSPRAGPSNPENRSVLVKDIHALLLAKAVSVEFPEIEVICLVRDPAAVAASKLTLELGGAVWFGEPTLLLQSEMLLSDWLSPFERAIREARTRFQKYVMLWAMMYHVISRQFEDSKITFVRYGDSQERILEIANKLSRAASDTQVASSEFVAAFKKRPERGEPGDLPKYTPTQWELQYSQEIIQMFGLEHLLRE